MCVCLNENECDYKACLHAFCFNVMPYTHAPLHKPLNYVLDDFTSTSCSLSYPWTTALQRRRKAGAEEGERKGVMATERK